MATHESTPRAPKCLCPASDAAKPSRNLVVCIDGTSNQFGPKNTNIVELYSHITKNDKQLTYYSSGLGTIAKVAVSSMRQRLSSELDMAIGRNLHKVIMASYRWLSDNYQDGDKIFLFGYSRGAYQVRALAGMISRVGLLLPGNNEQIPFAFELYSKTTDDDSSLARPASVISQPATKESKQKTKYTELAKTFQKTFCRGNVHVHFVGVWDTVSSVGFGRGKTLPCTTTSCEHVCYFRHALALDERRVKFLPEYVYGGRSSCSEDARIKEVWFAGSHADVGGGNRCNEKLQSGDIPLLWMRSQAIDAGLTMEPADVMWKIDDLNKRITPSLTGAWWLLEILPFKRLLYYNSDRRTHRPHLGGPRRILPGQKVHVSALFKNNYKPCARFYNNPEAWPEPMFWNDDNSHQRLQELSNNWEKDIFDENSIQPLLDGLVLGQASLDVLDRLGFMASFEDCKPVIEKNANAKRVLTTFLHNTDRLVRLSTAMICCELGWAREWHLKTTHAELGQQITDDVSKLLSSDQDCRRASTYLPSLCKWADLKPRLISDDNLKMLVKRCDNIRVGKREEGTSTVAFHSAQALSMLMKLDETFAERLIDIQLVSDIAGALQSNCKPMLVSVLNVLSGLAKYRAGRDSMKVGPTVATLLRLVKLFDDFVAPAAIRVLCALLPEDDLRMIMRRFGVLTIFLDMLDCCSIDTREVACQALVGFVAYDDVKHALLQEGYLLALANRVQHHTPSKRDGAISALVDLSRMQDATSSTSVRSAVTDAIKATKTILVLLGQLDQKWTALCAASVLARLVQIEDVAVMVSDEQSGVCAKIVEMLQHRWFDGNCGEDGLLVLSELFACDRLHAAVLTKAVDALRGMITSGQYESTYAGLHYLRVIARLDKGKGALSHLEMLGLVPDIVGALRVPHRGVRRIATDILRRMCNNSTSDDLEKSMEDVRAPIVTALLELLKERRTHVVLATSNLLSLLSTDEFVREKVLTDRVFWDLSHEYYNGLKLEYDQKGRGPRTGDVYQSVGRLIRLMQRPENDKEAATMIDGPNIDMNVEKDRGGDQDWLLAAAGPVPYEPKKEGKSAAYWMEMLLHPGMGQRVYRDLWQEG